VAFEDSLLTLRIIASETTWVQIMVDGSVKEGITMAPGSIRIFDAREDFKITLGNAGGVELNLNGRPIPPLGESGQVVRDIPLGWKTIESPSS
jgi:cytoskeleton protein RodZ